MFGQTAEDYKAHFKYLFEFCYDDSMETLEQYMSLFPGNTCDFSDQEMRGFFAALEEFAWDKFRSKVTDEQKDEIYRYCEVHFKRNLTKAANISCDVNHCRYRIALSIINNCALTDSNEDEPLLVQPTVKINKPMTDTNYPAFKRSARIAKQSQCSNTDGNNVVESENESDVVADVVASENESTTNNACSQGGVSQEKEISTPWQYEVGTTVTKHFTTHKEPYTGEVTQYDPLNKTYMVEYTDGDKEVLDEKELSKIVDVATRWRKDGMVADNSSTERFSESYVGEKPIDDLRTEIGGKRKRGKEKKKRKKKGS